MEDQTVFKLHIQKDVVVTLPHIPLVFYFGRKLAMEDSDSVPQVKLWRLQTPSFFNTVSFFKNQTVGLQEAGGNMR